MASIDTWRPKEPGGRPRWRARWRTPDGRQASKVFDRKVDAEHHLVEMEHSKLVGRYRDPDAGRVLFKDAAEAWRLRQVHRESTAVQVESFLRNHAYPTLGDRRLDSIRRSDVQAWVKDRSTVLAPSTLRTVYGFVASVFKDAVHDRLIPESPCVRIALPKLDRPEVVPPTREEVEALMAALPDRYQVAVVLAAGAGLRLGEVMGLTVDRVDFLRKTLRIDRQLVTPSTGPCVFGPPKTPSSIRTVHVADVVVEALAAHLAEFPVETSGEFAGLIVATQAGAPLRRSKWQDEWKRAQAKAGIECKFHNLRHYFASVLLSGGCSVVTVADALGHRTAEEVWNTYAHLLPSDVDRSREVVQAALGSASGVTNVSPAAPGEA